MARNKTYKETKLPKRVDKAIAGASWQTPDVLVGALRNRYQLDACLQCGFYHMPVTNIDPKKVQYVAIYQSLTLFGHGSGIRWYGKVTGWQKVRRYEIEELPKDSDEWYYRFDVKKWRRLTKPIRAGGVAFVHLVTNYFLLRSCKTVAELLVGSEHQFRWLWGLEKAMRHVKRFPKRESGFWFDSVLTLVTRNAMVGIRNDEILAQVQDVGALEGYFEEIYDLYGQLYPEYAGLDRNIEYE